MFEKKYNINQIYIGNLYFVKNSNKDLIFIRTGIFYNVKDNKYLDFETNEIYLSHDYYFAGDIVLDFNNFIPIKSFFEENNINYKNHMSIKEIANVSMFVKEKSNSEDYMVIIKKSGKSSYVKKRTIWY